MSIFVLEDNLIFSFQETKITVVDLDAYVEMYVVKERYRIHLEQVQVIKVILSYFISMYLTTFFTNFLKHGL